MPGLSTVRKDASVFLTLASGKLMLQDKLGSRGRSWESRGLGVVGLRPTCFSSDLQESPECRLGATLKATLLCGFPAFALSSSQHRLSFLPPGPCPQTARFSAGFT